jgi:hypothetical protein
MYRKSQKSSCGNTTMALWRLSTISLSTATMVTAMVNFRCWDNNSWMACVPTVVSWSLHCSHQGIFFHTVIWFGCYSLFRSIVLSLLIWTYPWHVSNYSLTICTTGLFLPLVSFHIAHANIYQTSPLSRYLAVHYLTSQRVLSHSTFLFHQIFPHLHNPSWSTHSESYPPVYP